MAKKPRKPKKKVYKYISEGDQEKYQKASKDELVVELKKHHLDLKAETKNKKDSQALKDAKKDIKEFDEKWERNGDLIQAKEAYDAILAERKEARDELQDNKNQLEFDFGEAIKTFKEHREFILNELSKRV